MIRYLAIPIAVLAAVAMLTACGSSHPAVHHQAAPKAPVLLSNLQACQRLLADIRRNGGTPDKPTLDNIATHVNDPRLATDLESAVPDVGTDLISLDLAALSYDCGKVGVQIPHQQG